MGKKERSEDSFWDRMRTQLGPLGRLTRIENGVGGGVPDVNYCIECVEGWMELKSAEATARELSLFLAGTELRKEQVGWHILQARNGGRSYIVTARGAEVFIHEGAHAAMIERATARDARALARVVFPYRDAWPKWMLPVLVGKRK